MIGFATLAVKPERIYSDFYAGRQCMCSMVHKDDKTGKWADTEEKPKRRSQLSSYYLFPKWQAHVFDFSICIPEYQDVHTIMDLHPQVAGRSPFYMVQAWDKLIFDFNGRGIYNMPIVLNEWLDCRIETNLYSYLRLFVNGEKIIDDEVKLKYDTVNFKIGCYEYYGNWENSDIRQVYFQI